MWITKQMEEDINSRIMWIPWAGNWRETLEYISDTLAGAGYSIEIKKVS